MSRVRPRFSIWTLGLAVGLGCLVFSAPVAAIGFHDFTPIGAADPLANGISTDQANGVPHLFVTTGEGFYAYDFTTETWDDYTNPGWIGCARYAVVPVWDLPDRRVLGGVNAWFKGTLWLSDDAGATQDLTYESDGGRVTDMVHAIVPSSSIYACTWSDIADGELLRSSNDGESWTLILGHGHHAMTGVEMVGESELYVSGDNYITRTLDHGASWEFLQGNLPVNQGLYTVLVPEPVTGLPQPHAKAQDRDDIVASFLLVSNDSGVYFSDSVDIDWQQVLPSSCRALAHRFVQVGQFIYWTETYAVTFDGRLLYCEDFDWSSWQDLTADIAPGIDVEPFDVAVSYAGVYVLVREHGVYRSIGPDHPTAAPERPIPLALHAAPNPFNPQTTVSFNLPTPQPVTLAVYDLGGNHVAALGAGMLPVGSHTMQWRGVDDRGRALPSGTYVLRLIAGDDVIVKKVTLVR